MSRFGFQMHIPPPDMRSMPFARRTLSEMPCPYCGRNSLVTPLVEDWPSDMYRIDMRCEADDCEIDSFSILAKSTRAGIVARADVEALVAIDPKTVREVGVPGILF